MIVRRSFWGSAPPIIDSKTKLIIDNDNTVTDKVRGTNINNLFYKNSAQFFENKNYGAGLKEILYKEICLSEEFKIFSEIRESIYSYSKRKKEMSIILEFDYDLIKRMDIPSTKEYIINIYIELTIGIKDLHDFFKL